MGRSDSRPLISPHFVAFVWRYRRLIPWFVPTNSGPELGIILELVNRAPHRQFDDGNGRVSQVPEHPSCPFALFLDPGRTEGARPLQRLRHGPRLCQQRRLPQTKISGLDHTALGVTVYASQ